MLVKNLLALVLVHSTIVVSISFGVSSTILVMVPVEAILFGGLDPITLFMSTLALFLALGSNCQRRYILKILVILYLIYSGSTSFTYLLR